MENENSLELIKSAFKELPPEVQEAITAPDFSKNIKLIASKHSLMLDQVDSLHKIILAVLLRLEPSSEFVNSVSTELGLNHEKSLLLSKDVNDTVFGPVRTHLQEWEEQAKKDMSLEDNEKQNLHQTISSIERTGNFTIEKEIPSEPGHGNNTNGNAVTHEDRDEILSGVENPPAHKGIVPANLPVVESELEASPSNSQDNYSEPLVDYLISNSIGQGEKEVAVETKAPTPPPPKPSEATPRPTIDPYREAMN